MTVFALTVDDFFAVLERSAARQAAAARAEDRGRVFLMGLVAADNAGVDEQYQMLYAQCALHFFDQRTLQ